MPGAVTAGSGQFMIKEKIAALFEAPKLQGCLVRSGILAMSKAEERSAHARRAKKTPKSPKPWDPRPKAARGSPTSDEVYRAVGMALTSWEYLENALANIYTAFLGVLDVPIENAPAVRAYGSIVGFQNRAAMIEAASEAFFHAHWNPAIQTKFGKRKNELSAAFAVLLSEATGYSGRRNEIAHGIVSPDEAGNFLYPSDYNTRKNAMANALSDIARERATYRYTAHDIHYYRQGFEDLYDRLSEFEQPLRLLASEIRAVRQERRRSLPPAAP